MVYFVKVVSTRSINQCRMDSRKTCDDLFMSSVCLNRLSLVTRRWERIWNLLIEKCSTRTVQSGVVTNDLCPGEFTYSKVTDPERTSTTRAIGYRNGTTRMDLSKQTGKSEVRKNQRGNRIKSRNSLPLVFT